MNKLLTLTSIIAIALTLSSCALQHQSLPNLSMAFFDHYQTNETDSLQYGYFQNLLQLSYDKRLKRWAKNHHYQIIGFNVINTSSQFRKGFQIKFYHKWKRIRPYRNEWIAMKARQNASGPALATIPLFLIEKALLHSDEDDEDDYITPHIFDKDEEVCNKANHDLLINLKNHDLSYKTLPYGLPVYGIVIFKSKEPLNDISISL